MEEDKKVRIELEEECINLSPDQQKALRIAVEILTLEKPLQKSILWFIAKIANEW